MKESLIITGAIVLFIVVAAIVVLCKLFYRVADIDKALIITGGKEPKIVVSGGSFVIPIFRKASYFDLCMLTVSADRDEIKTITAVPIVCDWTAQIRPTTNDITTLKKAIISFKERGQDGIVNDVKLTLTGAVRDIVASMTPEAVLKDKAEFAQKVRDTVEDEMLNMGMELVSLNIQDITDHNEYYNNLAALDHEEKRREAEKKRAIVGQEVRQQAAVSEQNAAQAELDAQLVIAEKKRDNDIKKAAYKAETDKAQADADIAGKLQTTVRMQEVAVEEGKVAVVKQEQANLAAMKEKEVIATRAEAEKERARITAEAEANVRKIQAENKVTVAEREACAIKIEAEANAAKKTKEGNALAEVTRLNGQAEADVIKQKGIAEAEAEKARLIAAAEGEKARLMAEAEGERALAEARASNEKVNFEIEKLKIETDAKITVATKTAEIMAEVGKNAEFVNFGGQQGTGTGNILLDTLSGIPQLLKKLDIENNALNGEGIIDTLANAVSKVTASKNAGSSEIREEVKAIPVQSEVLPKKETPVAKKPENENSVKPGTKIPPKTKAHGNDGKDGGNDSEELSFF